MSGFLSLATLLMEGDFIFIFNGFFLLNRRNLFPSHAGPSVTGGMVFGGRRNLLLDPQRVSLAPKHTLPTGGFICWFC